MLIPLEDLTSAIKDRCKEEDVKYTAKKLLIVKMLYREEGFIDADNRWLKIVQDNKISRASVYLYLRWLTNNDFLTKKLLGRLHFYQIKQHTKDPSPGIL